MMLAIISGREWDGHSGKMSIIMNTSRTRKTRPCSIRKMQVKALFSLESIVEMEVSVKNKIFTRKNGG